METTKRAAHSGGPLAAVGLGFILLLIGWIPFYNWIGTAWQIKDSNGQPALDPGTGATIAQAIAGSLFWLIVMGGLIFVIAHFSGGWLAGWDTRELVTVAVIGATFGAVFDGWTLLTSGPLAGLVAGLGPWANLENGIWFIPAFLAPYIIRKPGAALFAEAIAASVSFLLGSPWGFLGAVVAGLVQGLGAEVAFALFGWRNYRLAVMLLAGFISAAASFAFVYPIWNAGYDVLYNSFGFVATVIGVTGLGVLLSIALAEALRATGVLDRFALVREQRAAAKLHG